MKITTGTSPPMGHRSDALRQRERAQEIALTALAFLARDMDRIERFLALTGVDPGELRAHFHDAGFQLAILDHIAADEPLLLTFAAEERLQPEEVGRARRALGGGDESGP